MGVGEIDDAIALVNTISHLSMLTAVHWSMFFVESHFELVGDGAELKVKQFAPNTAHLVSSYMGMICKNICDGFWLSARQKVAGTKKATLSGFLYLRTKNYTFLMFSASNSEKYLTVFTLSS